MAPPQLPRLTSFPVFAEDHLVTTTLGASLVLPLTIRKKFPLKGQLAPDFILTDQEGRQCRLHDTLKLGRPVILFTFPLAGLPHCTKQSCLFRDALELTPIFDVMQAIVIGISQDPPAKGQQFAGQHKLTYPILYDYKRKVMDRYGVGKSTMGLFDTRATFVIDPSGIVRGLAEGVFNSKDHVKFAEKWLVKLEEELSERSKLYYNYVAQDGDMIAKMQLQRNADDRVLQVVYGERKLYGGSPSTASLATMTTRKSNKKDKWKNWKLILSQLSTSPGKFDEPKTPLPAYTASAAQLTDASNSGRDDIKEPHESATSSQPAPRLSRKSSLRRAKDAEKSMMTENGLVPPVPPLPQVIPTGSIIAAPPSPSYSHSSTSQRSWIHPLDAAKAGWTVNQPVGSSDIEIPSIDPSLSKAALQSSSDSAHMHANPLVANVFADEVTRRDQYQVEMPASGVTSEVLIGTVLSEKKKKASSPPTSPLYSSLPLPAVSTFSSDNDNEAKRSIDSIMSPYKPEQQLTVEDGTIPSSVGGSGVVQEAQMEGELFANLLKSFPRVPSPTNKPTEQLIIPPSSGLQRSVSFDKHLDQLPKRTSYLPVKSHQSFDYSNEVGSFQRKRQSIDSDITVPDKHTSFDQQQHHQNAADRGVLQRRLPSLSQDISKESLLMVAMVLQIYTQQQQEQLVKEQHILEQQIALDLD